MCVKNEMRIISFLRNKGIALTSILLLSTFSLALAGYAQPPEVVVMKDVDPVDIQLYGTGSPDMTNVTISVTGYGGTFEETLPIDVVYAIDSSGSMSWNDPTNLRIDAAKSFTDKLDPTRDQAGVVSWDDNIDFTYGLTNDFTALKNQIDNVDSSGDTNLNVGLNAAIAMLDTNTRVEDSAEVIIFLTDGQGIYTPSGVPGSPADNAANKGYVIYSIGLAMVSGSPAEVNLIDMADATGGMYYSAPTAENLQTVFDEILETIITSTAPYGVDIVEVTQSYIVDEGDFSVAPDSMAEVDGKTVITWLNVSRFVGDFDGRLTAEETFTVSFTAGSTQCGKMLPVDVEDEAVVNYYDPEGDPQSVDIPQAYINVNCPPCCRYAYASPEVLWPPNHKLVDITIMNVTDRDGDPITITITAIYQDEPTNGLGDGDTSPDGFGVGTDTAQVRSERSGTANGRVYHIYFMAEDGMGGVCEGEVTVSVPHDQRDEPAVDDGPLYDSTMP